MNKVHSELSRNGLPADTVSSIARVDDEMFIN